MQQAMTHSIMFSKTMDRVIADEVTATDRKRRNVRMIAAHRKRRAMGRVRAAEIAYSAAAFDLSFFFFFFF